MGENPHLYRVSTRYKCEYLYQGCYARYQCDFPINSVSRRFSSSFYFLFFLFYFFLSFLLYSISHLISNKHKIQHLISQHKIHLISFRSQISQPKIYMHKVHKIHNTNFSQLTVSKLNSHISHKNNTTNMYNKN